MTATLPLPTLPLDLLTTEQKFELIHVIEASIEPRQKAVGEEQLPEWQRQILRERKQAVAEGKTHFIPLDEFMRLARKITS